MFAQVLPALPDAGCAIGSDRCRLPVSRHRHRARPTAVSSPSMAKAWARPSSAQQSEVSGAGRPRRRMPYDAMASVRFEPGSAQSGAGQREGPRRSCAMRIPATRRLYPSISSPRRAAGSTRRSASPPRSTSCCASPGRRLPEAKVRALVAVNASGRALGILVQHARAQPRPGSRRRRWRIGRRAPCGRSDPASIGLFTVVTKVPGTMWCLTARIRSSPRRSHGTGGVRPPRAPPHLFRRVARRGQDLRDARGGARAARRRPGRGHRHRRDARQEGD